MSDELKNMFKSLNISYEQAIAVTFITIIAAIIICGILLVKTIVNWKIFHKAGVPGEFSLVPVGKSLYFSQIVFGKMRYAWLRLSFYVYAIYALGIVRMRLPKTSAAYTIAGIVEIITIGTVLYYRFAFCRGLSRCFGKGIGTSIGLFVMPTLFRVILLCSKAQYVGPGEFPIPRTSIFASKKNKHF